MTSLIKGRLLPLTALLSLLATAGCADHSIRQAENGIGGTGRSPAVPGAPSSDLPGPSAPGTVNPPQQTLPALEPDHGPPQTPDAPPPGTSMQPPGVVVPVDPPGTSLPGNTVPGSIGPTVSPGSVPGTTPGG